MRDALARHDAILRDAVDAHGGQSSRRPVTASTPRSRTASDAVDAAIAAQLALHAEDWTSTGPLRVRMGVHTGAAEVRDGDYYGGGLEPRRAADGDRARRSDRCCRSRPASSSATTTIDLVDLGEHRLRDLGRPSACSRSAHPASSASSRRSRSLESFPTNLPLQSTSFVGRRRGASTDVVDGARRRIASSRSRESAASARPASRSRWRPRCCRSYRDGVVVLRARPGGQPRRSCPT